MNGLANALPDDVETLKAMLLAERARADRLAQIIKGCSATALIAARRPCRWTSSS